MYLNRASFLHEGVLLRLLDSTVQARVKVSLRVEPQNLVAQVC
jgi:hypothetical protein